jgi:arylsulfatase A-like enzyme
MLATAATIGGSLLFTSRFTPRITSGVVEAQPSASLSPSAPNVLMIVLDTVRHDRFAPSVNDSLTPNLNQIAAQGIRYENAWACSSWSLPSQVSLLTGLYPHEHGADWPGLALDKAVPTLDSFLFSHGYVTGAFSGNSAWITPEYFGRGFLHFDVYTLEDHLRRTANGRKVNKLLEPLGSNYAGRGKKAPAINREFLSFLDRYPEHPFFGFLCYMDVNQGFHHARLNRPFWQREATVAEVLAAYDAALHQLDVHIGELFSELARRGKLENTIVIITSDHGESFGSAETTDHDPAGHGTSLYPEQTRVPLWIVYPNVVEAGKEIRQTVSLRAIPATITTLLQLENSPFVGAPLALDERLTGQDEAILTTLNYADHILRAVVQENWLLIRNEVDGREELFDLTKDPLARTNLSANQPRLATLQNSLEQLLAQKPGKS